MSLREFHVKCQACAIEYDQRSETAPHICGACGSEFVLTGLTTLNWLLGFGGPRPTPRDDGRKLATLVRDGAWRGNARLYRVQPPMIYREWSEVAGDYEELTTDYVVVSAVCAMGTGDETYIFPADQNGEALNISEMEGSFRGEQDHEQALRNAGYEVVS